MITDVADLCGVKGRWKERIVRAVSGIGWRRESAPVLFPAGNLALSEEVYHP